MQAPPEIPDLDEWGLAPCLPQPDDDAEAGIQKRSLRPHDTSGDWVKAAVGEAPEGVTSVLLCKRCGVVIGEAAQ